LFIVDLAPVYVKERLALEAGGEIGEPMSEDPRPVHGEPGVRGEQTVDAPPTMASDQADPADSQQDADRLASIASLGEPTRRALYDHLVVAGGWVGRDEAAAAVGVERGTAAHHLDRLAADGLVEVDFQRRTGRSGPGAGRPAKLYRRARRDIEVSLPPRDYELAGRLLARAAEQSRSEGTDIVRALDHEARVEGRRLADQARVRPGGRPGGHGRDRRRRAVLDVLVEHGFEPVGDDEIVLRNCPFHRLAREHTELVCGMNLSLLSAVLEHAGDTGLSARLEPEEGVCCVRLGSTR
jgi:predicted ArsR family transcriptional regulator